MAPPVIAILGNVSIFKSEKPPTSKLTSSKTKHFQAGFLTLYLFAGIVSSTVSLLFSRVLANNPFYQSHGASGAVYGTIAFFAAAFPTTTFLLFFVVPVPAWLLVGGVFGWDLYSSLYRRGGTTDSAGRE